MLEYFKNIFDKGNHVVFEIYFFNLNTERSSIHMKRKNVKWARIQKIIFSLSQSNYYYLKSIIDNFYKSDRQSNPLEPKLS